MFRADISYYAMVDFACMPWPEFVGVASASSSLFLAWRVRVYQCLKECSVILIALLE